MTSGLLLAIIMWCKADPYPYKTVAVCRRELIQCVKEGNTNCFEHEELPPWPDFNKEVWR